MPTSTAPPASTSSASSPHTATILPLQPLKPDLHERAWSSAVHPTLPLIATAHAKSTTVFSLATLSSHSTLTGGHSRSVRSVAWKPGLPPHKLCLVTGSFDSTAGLWRWDGDDAAAGDGGANGGETLEREITSLSVRDGGNHDETDTAVQDWDFTLVLEGHDSEVKSCAFSPSGAYLATCSRDKSVWIWEDIGATEADDEWETIAVLSEHEADVKAIAWCPDLPARNARRGCYAPDVLASASYDNTLRIWREDADAEWVCVAVLEGHDGTVWGLQWEPRPRSAGGFPRLLSHSADGTIRIWTLTEDDDEDEERANTSGPVGASGLGRMPNTMRRSLREDWTCTVVLPKVHDRDIYSVTWSAQTSLVASTGTDGVIALYAEDSAPSAQAVNGDHSHEPQTNGAAPSWRVLHTRPGAHGPYEVNHITWCRRYDAESTRRGEEEMLVTTGDDGLVRPWQVVVNGGEASTL